MCKYCEVSNSHIINGSFGSAVYSESENDIVSTKFEACKIVKVNGKYAIKVSGNYEQLSEHINYCPFCGRELTNTKMRSGTYC